MMGLAGGAGGKNGDERRREAQRRLVFSSRLWLLTQFTARTARGDVQRSHRDGCLGVGLCAAVVGVMARPAVVTGAPAVQGMEAEDRRAAYAADVTYVTNSELGFDYLRDNLAQEGSELVLQRAFNFCIIDEVRPRRPRLVTARFARSRSVRASVGRPPRCTVTLRRSWHAGCGRMAVPGISRDFSVHAIHAYA